VLEAVPGCQEKDRSRDASETEEDQEGRGIEARTQSHTCTGTTSTDSAATTRLDQLFLDVRHTTLPKWRQINRYMPESI
jgi:hypothetical protein